MISFIFFKIVLNRNLNIFNLLKSYSITSWGRDFVLLQSFNVMRAHTTYTFFMLPIAYTILRREFQFLCRRIDIIIFSCFINRVVMLDIVGVDAFSIQVGSFFVVSNRCDWYRIEQSFLINKFLSCFFWKCYLSRKYVNIVI